MTVHPAHDQRSFQIDHASTLSELVTNPALHSWWPGTVIAERGATAVAQQQLSCWRICARQADSGTSLAATIGSVIQQLSALQVTGRQFTSLDPDWVRLRPEANRKLQGSYDLYIAAAPTQVRVMGALSHPGSELAARTHGA